MATAKGTATVTASALNVRKGAGTNYAKLGLLSNGAKVSYYGENNGWLQISYNGQTGYISKQYTKTTASSSGGGSSSSGSSSSGSVQVTASALNVRKGAGTGYGILGSLAKGKVVSYSAESNGWLKITYNGQVGWISKQYTSKVSSSGSGSNSGSTSSGNSSSSGNTSTKTMYVTASTLNVRSGAGTNTSVLGTLSRGASVAVISTSNGWSKISYNGKTAYVSAQYLSSTKTSGGSGNVSGGSGTPGGGTINYKQGASPWGPLMYSSCNNASQTYKNSACGPTSMANVVATKVNSSVTPYTLGTWAVSRGHRTKNNGTAWAFMPDAAAKYGLSCKQCGPEEGLKLLKDGALATASMSAGYWTSGGHYITPYAVSNGNVYCDDPASTTRKFQNTTDFKKQCRQMWIFK